MRNLGKLAGTALLVLAGTAVALAAPASAGPPMLDARGCFATLHVVFQDPARIQPRFVPEHYRLLTWAPGKPYVALWSFSCDSLSVEGGPPRPTRLSVEAVPIQHPERLAAEQPLAEMPNTWAHYARAVVTDNLVLAGRLARAGQPARYEADMGFSRTTLAGGAPDPVLPLSETRVRVGGHWTSWTRPLIQQEPAHSHSNEFWFDGPRGTSRLELEIPLAEDHFCELAQGELCGTVDAVPGSATAEFLGQEHVSADAAVDHEKIDRVVAWASTR